MIERAVKFPMRILDIQENTRGVVFDVPMPDLPDVFPNPWMPQNFLPDADLGTGKADTSATSASPRDDA